MITTQQIKLPTFTQLYYAKFRIYYAVGQTVKFYEWMTKRNKAKRFAHLCRLFSITYSVVF